MIGIQQTVGDNRPPLPKLRPPQIVGAGDAGEGFIDFLVKFRSFCASTHGNTVIHISLC